MVTAITEGIKITVETLFRPKLSKPDNAHFVFAYRIQIQNLSNNEIKLVRRHWFIFDSDGSHREVEGEGVVGQQPILDTGEEYTYISECHLSTEIGRMGGYYSLIRTSDNNIFKVEIPQFQLIADYRLN